MNKEMLENIPKELRALPQWVATTPFKNEEGKVRKPPFDPKQPLTNSFEDRLASVTSPRTWTTFDQASVSGYDHVGFVLTKGDGFTIIDLDNKEDNPATAKQLARFEQIIKQANSYTEISASGRGVHIIVRGTIDVGVHKDNVEIYSADRYMICTGNALNDLPIADCQEMLDGMVAELSPDKPAQLELLPQTKSDSQVLETAMTATNKDKFIRLWKGDIQGYQSNSEADLALLSIICHYTKSNDQAIKLFRMSELGQRKKSNRDDYVYSTLVRARNPLHQPPPPIDTKEMLANANKVKQEVADIPEVKTGSTLDNIPYPVGLVGELARFIDAHAHKSFKEVAISGALTYLAGMVGRTFNISNTGLNIYCMVMAGTGKGKEAASKGHDAINAAIIPNALRVMDFKGPARFASGPALRKSLTKQPCFVSIQSEFGAALHGMCGPRPDKHSLDIKSILLDAYGKSGFKQYMGSTEYSNDKDTVKPVESPCLSIMAEGAQATFIDTLTEEMIADGFMPRFMFLEYNGPRQLGNKNPVMAPNQNTIDTLANIANMCLDNQDELKAGIRQPIRVQMSTGAEAMLDKYEMDLTNYMNDNDKDEALTQMWNRSHLNALKVGALLAVGVNHHNPVIDEGMAKWAIDFVNACCQGILKKLETGDFGTLDARRCNIVLKLMRSYKRLGKKKKVGYKVAESIIDLPNIIPLRFLTQRLRRRKEFAQREGSFKNTKQNLTDVIDMMVDAGQIKIYTPHQMNTAWGYNAEAYELMD